MSLIQNIYDYITCIQNEIAILRIPECEKKCLISRWRLYWRSCTDGRIEKNYLLPGIGRQT